jgi:putative heme-binding domain-containing protein
LARLDSPESHQVIGEWLDRIEEGSCPRHIELDVLEAAAASSDAALSDRQKSYAEKASPNQPLGQFTVCVEGGDAARGKRIFEEHTALSCRRCHGTKPGENLVGPNLASIGLERKREELLESIVNPNAKITEGFKTTVLQLDTGEVVSGILRREDDAQATFVDAEGKEFTVAVDSIEERLEGKSAMPEKLAELATRRELRDLVEYLQSLRALRDEPSAQGK